MCYNITIILRVLQSPNFTLYLARFLPLKNKNSTLLCIPAVIKRTTSGQMQVTLTESVTHAVETRIAFLANMCSASANKLALLEVHVSLTVTKNTKNCLLERNKSKIQWGISSPPPPPVS